MTQTSGLDGLVIVVAGGGGPTGEAVVRRLAAGGALADAFSGTASAAAILVVKALLTDAMLKESPGADFSGHTHVNDLAAAIADLWERPADELNGRRLDLA